MLTQYYSANCRLQGKSSEWKAIADMFQNFPPKIQFGPQPSTDQEANQQHTTVWLTAETFMRADYAPDRYISWWPWSAFNASCLARHGGPSRRQHRANLVYELITLKYWYIYITLVYIITFIKIYQMLFGSIWPVWLKTRTAHKGTWNHHRLRFQEPTQTLQRAKHQATFGPMLSILTDLVVAGKCTTLATRNSIAILLNTVGQSAGSVLKHRRHAEWQQ